MSSQKESWRKAFENPESRRWLFGRSKTRIVDLMLGFLKENKVKVTKILDVGCGSGRNAIALAKMGFEVWGIDFLEEALNELVRRAEREGVDVKTVCHDITASPWPIEDELFDAAIVHVVLDSVERSKRRVVAKELWRVLRKNGWLFVIRAVRKRRILRTVRGRS